MSEEKTSGRWWYAGIAAAVFALDRITKALAAGLPEEGVALIPGVLRLRRTENTGIAFSILSGVPWLPAVLAIAVLAGGFLLLRKQRLAAWPMTGLMMMAGGALGNLADRLFTGAVTDMVEPLFIRFAVFNVADAFLTVGCALVIISLLFRPKDWRSGKTEA